MKRSSKRPLISLQQSIKAILADLEIPLVVALGLLGLVFSTLGFRQYYQSLGQPYTWGDCIFQAVQLLSLNSGAVPPDAPVPWMLQIGRFLTPLVTFYAILKTLAAIFRDQWHLLHIRGLRNQRIVCGLGRKGWLLARQLRQAGYRVVVVERDPTNPHLVEARSLGCQVVLGDARNAITLRKAGIRRANALVAVCGQDQVNAEVAAAAREIMVGHKGKPLTCTIHIEDTRLWLLLRELELASTEPSPLRLEFFNVFENGAYLVADQIFAPHSIQSDSAWLVVGLGHLGESLVVNLARNWAQRFMQTGQRITVLAVDPRARQICASLQQRVPLIQQVLDVKPLEMDVHSAEFHCGQAWNPAEGGWALHQAVICLEEDAAALESGLSLLQQAHNQALQVVVVQWEDTGFSGLQLQTSNLHIFGLLDRTCQSHLLDDGTHERLARAIHRVYLRTFPPEPGKPLAGSAHVAWDQLAENYKNANRNQADDITRKLRLIGYQIRPWVELEALDVILSEDEVKFLGPLEHIRWVNERKSQGWRYGPERDNQRKLNPDLLPWDDPRFTQVAKEKDYNTVRNIPAYLLEAGFQLEKMEPVEHS